MPHAVFIQQPAVDFTTFLGVAHEALGYSPAGASDSSHRRLSESERFVSCLAALGNNRATPGFRPHLLQHLSFSILVAAEDRDLIEILEITSGMPFVRATTKVRGVELAVITGTLAEWRNVVISGTQCDGPVQELFNKVLTLFEGVGVNVWAECTRRSSNGLLLLEFK